MKYFLPEKERAATGSTCYLEFMKGVFDDSSMCWRVDSLNMSEENFDLVGMAKPLLKVLPKFDYYGTTEVTKADWEALKELARIEGGKFEEAISELTPWAEENFKTEEVFTIFGL